ncbi:MAG: MlaD family protein, partial [Pseudomonadota bacterium]
MSDSLPKAEIEPEPRGRDRLSLTWLVPIGALVIALAVTWQVYSERGPLLEVSLRNASGLATGQTVLRYRDVEIGVVESLRFAEDLSSVIAAIRIEKDMAPYLDEDAKIWAVRPQVSANGVSGLDTVISGVYLAASFDNQADGMLPLIVAERAAPLTPAGEPGRRIRLRGSDGGSISVGAPILFKGVDVGRIESKAISEEGDAVLFDAFIDAPYDRFVTESALFWNASGLALNLGPGGAELNVSSLASLVRGGVAFDTLGVSLRPAEDGQEYRLYPNEEAAQDSLLNVDQGIEVEFSAVFSGTLRGLTVGAPVEYRGVRVGEVLSLSTRLNLTVTPRRPELLTTLVIRPRRFGLDLDTTPAETVAFLNELVAEGLRARLAPTGLLGGTMVVELFETGERGRAVLSNDGRRPRIPSTAPSGGGFAASAEGVLRRVNDLPFEDLVAGAVTFVNSLNRIINDPAVRDAPASATALIEDLRALVAREELQRAPDELLAAITQMRSLVDGIAASDAAGSLDEITGQATALLASLSASVDGVAPALTAATALIEDLRALPLDDATAEAVGVIGGVNELVATLQALAADPDLLATPGAARAFVGDLRTFLNSDGVQGAPDTLRQTLDQTTALLNALETSGAVDNLTATL